MNRKLKAFAFAALVMAGGLMLTACTPNPAGPSAPDPPDQSGYEPLPTEPHRLLDADGNPTRMWATLNSVNPLRGSTIVLSQSCFTPSGPTMNCFSMELTVGLDALPNPYTAAGFDAHFSQDGITIGQVIRSVSIRGGGTETLANPDYPAPFNERPMYLIIKASYRGDVNGTYGTFPGESGATNFLLDYR